VPGGAYETLSGTSMAAPHVTGTWALLRQAAPAATVDDILNALRQTGRPVMDLRFGGTEIVPRIRAFQALASLTGVSKPLPTLTFVSPTRVRSGQGPITLTLVGTGFDAFTTAVWHGAPQSTTVLSATLLQTTIAASDITGATALVSVSTPGPGGGSSLAKSVTIDAAAMLSTNTPAATPGQTVTVTIGNGKVAPNDWLALAQTGASDRTYLQMIYAGSLAADRKWAVTMPMAAGTYEFRLFLDNGFARAATSPTVTVGP
jgi:subtilisin family serine protease